MPRRVTIEDGPSGLVVTAPVRGMGCAATFLTLWLMPWALGEFAVIRALAEEGLRFTGDTVFFLFWLAGWTVGGCVALGTIVYAFTGREVVTLGSAALTTKRGVGPTVTYELRLIRHLRIEKDRLLFHYEGENVRIGAYLRPDEAPLVLDAILARQPGLAEDWHAPLPPQDE